MSGLEALGLTCSIFQVISFAHETLNVVKKIYRDGKFETTVSDNAARLESLVAGMGNKSRALPHPQSHEIHQLLETSKKCQSAANDLVRETSRVSESSSKPGGLTAAVRTTFKARLHRRKLETLEEKFSGLERVLFGGLLARIFQTTENVQYDMDDLDGQLRSFIAQYESGFRTTSDLVSKEANDTRQHITDESQKTQTAVTENLERLKLEETDQRVCDAFLCSFKFDGMNQRRNEDSRQHRKTFKWVLESEESNSDSDDDEPGDTRSAVSPPRKIWDSFPAWLQSPETTSTPYWISGKPGSGKTTLVKHILNSPQTLDYLNSWKQHAIIVSHFFWKIGSNKLQKNLKGFLCSVVYQLLEKDADILKIIASAKGARSRDTESDWSVESLWELLQDIIREYKRPIFLIIDGLDELETQNDIPQLFDMLGHLHKPGTAVKICLASRSEPILRKRLRLAPQLRLQDLTFQDIQRFVHDNIIVRSVQLNWYQKDDLVGLITSKAEGVFLWAYLVVKNIGRGMDLGDEYEILEKRVQALPSDLADLYRDMWSRMNGDDAVYQRDAAAYFNIVVACNDMEITASPLLVGLAMDKTIRLELQRSSYEPSFPAEVLIAASEKVMRTVEARSAGLLEISPVKYPKTLRWHDEAYGELDPYGQGSNAISFIHRTASDFLQDTADGKDMLDRDGMSEWEARFELLDAYLAQSQIFLLEGGVVWFLRKFQRLEKSKAVLESAVLKGELLRCIDLCKQLCESGKIAEQMDLLVPGISKTVRFSRRTRFLRTRRFCRSERFFVLAAERDLASWVSGELENIPEDVKSLMLLSASTNPGASKTLALLVHDANPNYAENCQLAKTISITYDPNSKQVFAVYQTPWARYLAYKAYSNCYEPEIGLTDLQILNEYINCGADLEEPVYLFVDTTPHTYWANISEAGPGWEINANIVVVRTTARVLAGLVLDGWDQKQEGEKLDKDTEGQCLWTALSERLRTPSQPFTHLLALKMQRLSESVAKWIEGDWKLPMGRLIRQIISSRDTGGALMELEEQLEAFWENVEEPEPFWRPDLASGGQKLTMLRDLGRREAWFDLDERFGERLCPDEDRKSEEGEEEEEQDKV